MLFLQSLTNVDKATVEAADSLAHVAQAKASTWFHLLLEHPDTAMKDLGGWALHAAWIGVQAIAVFLIGRWIIKKLLRLIDRLFSRRTVDASIATFTKSVVKAMLYIILLMAVVSILGIKTTSFLAIFAAAGFAVGMAMSGTLQNFAGGIMVLLLKPYRVGDYIVTQGYEGTVDAIQLFSTIITTADNKTVYIPNGPMSTGIVLNTSRQETRRAEWIAAISYGDDFALARKVMAEILAADPRILKDPAPTIAIKELAESSVNVVVRAWVNAGDFWDVFFDVNAAMYKTLPERGISFPFNQIDVHITGGDGK